MSFRVRLKDISRITMGQSPSGVNVNNSGVGHPLLNGPTEFEMRFPLPTQFTTEGKKFSEPGDILFCVRGSTTGRMNYSNQVYAIGRGIASIKGINGYPTTYVRALIDLNLQKLLGAATGTTFPNLGKDTLENFEMDCVEPNHAKKIAEILDSIDLKIYQNNQINQTLEEMAQAIFKSWFVDFDPVKAKAQVIAQGGSEQDANLAAMQIISGKTRDQLAALERAHPEQYTQLHTTASLFPSAFVKSELGEIPEGWGGTNVSSILTLNYGRALKSTDRITGDVPVYGSGGVNGYHNEPLVTEESIVVGRKGSIGNLFWVDKPFFPIDTTFYVSTKNVPLSFCYYTLMELNLSNMNTDAAVPGLNRENVYRCELCLPPSEILVGFDTIQSSLKQLISSNSREISHLESIRDSLLPKLLSGELEI